ncbi:MAG: caspase family protein [Treponema sp.]|nr:caspase family protein [Treponema sp.]
MKKLFFLFAICAFATGFLFAEAKNALLIANAAYGSAPLSTPIQESRGLKKTLEKLGFAVTIVENGGRERMLDALDDFGHLLKVKGGVGFFHYGGHAVQFNGKNYLIPVDADISDERRVATRAVDLDDVMFSMAADTNIVILDSCRDNPFPSATRGTTRGLALSYIKPKNSIIVYSAEAGKKAQDGVFTPILTQKLLQRKSLVSILTEVRREVNKATGGLQLPKNDDGLLDDVYLAGFSGAPLGEPEPVIVPEPAPAPVAISTDQAGEDVAILAALNGGDLCFASKELFRFAQNKAGTSFPIYGGLQNTWETKVYGKNYVSSSGKNVFAINLGEHVLGVLRYSGNRNGKVGFFLGVNGTVKDKALQERLQAAASKLGWETKVVKSSSSSKEEAEYVMESEALFMSHLSDYNKIANELAEILKAAK